ncbi:MAG: fluoride efflux transporter CrcB [Proteobacteria bacterium]|nr:fluoride efflux transporter CrcB [Pseudomonadota bacterium]MDA1059525.1 fluoride efflux transporter CrcB [Pseudomonadota bacterium]
MKIIAAIAIGGAVGAVARHLVGAQMLKLLGHGFPWGTITANVAGSFALGALVEVMALRWNVGPELRAFMTVGVLGAFTTFSTFSLDVAVLSGRGALVPAGLYVLATVSLSIVALFFGLWLFRQLLA